VTRYLHCNYPLLQEPHWHYLLGRQAITTPSTLTLILLSKQVCPIVFAHGMLSMAWLGRLLTQWVPQRQIVQFNARFAGITHLEDAPLCTGKVIEKLESDGQQLLKIELHVTNQNSETKIIGDALIAI